MVPASASVGSGTPSAVSVNATATPAVVAYGPAPPVNHGASGSWPSVVAETTADQVPVGAARTRTW